MGLDVGVVKIEYLDRPREPVYGFLWSLADQFSDFEWGEVWEGNAFIELTELNMLTRAAIYATEHNLTAQETYDLENWIKTLPWSGDLIMLHLGW